MVLEHHKLRAFRGEPDGLVEPFRRADWVDVTRGLVDVRTAAEPAARGLLDLARRGVPQATRTSSSSTRLRTHPRSPLPMLRL